MAYKNQRTAVGFWAYFKKPVRQIRNVYIRYSGLRVDGRSDVFIFFPNKEKINTLTRIPM